MKIMDAVPREITPIPIGQRVRSVANPELTGTVVVWEMHKSGALSAIPYKVQWDDEALARAVRGAFCWWGEEKGDLEPIA